MDIFSPSQIHPSISKRMTDQKIENLQRSLRPGGTTKTEEELKSVAREFESILIYKMVSAMRATVPKSELFGSFSMDMFESMMDQELANEMARGKGIGLSEMIYKQLDALEKKASQRAASPAGSRHESVETIDLKTGGIAP